MLKYRIREAEPGDIQTIFDFERNYVMEHEPDMLEKWDSVKKKNIEQLMERLEHLFVADSGEGLVGHAYWSMLDGSPCIFSTYVVDEARGMGVATSLITKCEEHISKAGYDHVVVSALVDNPAQHLYLKLGYEITGTLNGWIYFAKQLD